MSATRQHPAFAGMRAPRLSRTLNAGVDPLAGEPTTASVHNADTHKPDPFRSKTFATRQALESMAAALDVLPTD